jgi:hypothetical protein
MASLPDDKDSSLHGLAVEVFEPHGSCVQAAVKRKPSARLIGGFTTGWSLPYIHAGMFVANQLV